ncbi:hypothetical protein SAMN05216207_10913 [Pseudonocardia ammonioxydans]|uniref:Uncharacterized protein n=1 Tax=Pseudonocardia ammonioxydans TaxID=260086 RepID=A0A1I5I889_PSUAM|nr:hypothetical protein SAMN05216207_10913 [Pseudonocardia ammonioxydans]
MPRGGAAANVACYVAHVSGRPCRAHAAAPASKGSAAYKRRLRPGRRPGDRRSDSLGTPTSATARESLLLAPAAVSLVDNSPRCTPLRVSDAQSLVPSAAFHERRVVTSAPGTQPRSIVGAHLCRLLRCREHFPARPRHRRPGCRPRSSGSSPGTSTPSDVVARKRRLSSPGVGHSLDSTSAVGAQRSARAGTDPRPDHPGPGEPGQVMPGPRHKRRLCAPPQHRPCCLVVGRSRRPTAPCTRRRSAACQSAVALAGKVARWVNGVTSRGVGVMRGEDPVAGPWEVRQRSGPGA